MVTANRPLPLPVLGRHATQCLSDDAKVFEDQQDGTAVHVFATAAYALPVETPFSSESSSSSACSSGSCSSSLKGDGASPPGFFRDDCFTASAKSAAFGERTNTTANAQKMLEQSTPQASPLKVRSKVPTLDAIAARMRTMDRGPKSPRSQNGGDKENVQTNDGQNRHGELRHSSSMTRLALGSTPTQTSTRTQRGRTSSLATLVDRAANRSHSTSPTKKGVSQTARDSTSLLTANVASNGSAALSSSPSKGAKETPSLQDIVKRMKSKKVDGEATPAVPSSTASSVSTSPALGGSSPIVSPPSSAHSQTSAKVDSSVPTLPSEAESIKCAGQEKTPSKPVSVKPNEHPLEHKWAIYFDSKSWAPSPSIPQKADSSTSRGANASSAHSWEATLKMLGQYESVESFMTVFRTLRRPSQLERNSNYHLFKDGIKPMWEDSANLHGGKWVVTLRTGNSALLDRSWMWLVLALIGEDLDEADDVCGAVVSTRAKGDRIALWVRNKNDVELVNKIGRRFISLLELEREPGVSLEFTINNHEEDIGDSSICSTQSAPSSRGQSTRASSRYYSFSNPPATTNGGENASGANKATMMSGHLNANPFQQHTPQQQQQRPNMFQTTPFESPVSANGSLGAHLRLNVSPGKMSAGGRSPMLNKGSLGRRQSRDQIRLDAPNGDASLLGGQVGLGVPIGRGSSPSPSPSQKPFAQRPGFGLMNRSMRVGERS